MDVRLHKAGQNGATVCFNNLVHTLADVTDGRNSPVTDQNVAAQDRITRVYRDYRATFDKNRFHLEFESENAPDYQFRINNV